MSLKYCFGRPRTLSGIRFGVYWICSGIVLILFFCFVGFLLGCLLRVPLVIFGF